MDRRRVGRVRRYQADLIRREKPPDPHYSILLGVIAIVLIVVIAVVLTQVFG